LRGCLSREEQDGSEDQGDQYASRRELLGRLQQSGAPLDIVTSDRKLSYTEFLEKINEYKWILNPLGTGQFINLRHYEAIYFNTIVLQETTDEILKWYPEIHQDSVIFKRDNIFALPEATMNFKQPQQKVYLEDYFNNIDLKKFIK
jgi:hypothetical protein